MPRSCWRALTVAMAVAFALSGCARAKATTFRTSPGKGVAEAFCAALTNTKMPGPAKFVEVSAAVANRDYGHYSGVSSFVRSVGARKRRLLFARPSRTLNARLSPRPNDVPTHLRPTQVHTAPVARSQKCRLQIDAVDRPNRDLCRASGRRTSGRYVNWSMPSCARQTRATKTTRGLLFRDLPTPP